MSDSFNNELPKGMGQTLLAVGTWTLLCTALYVRLLFIEDEAYRKGRKPPIEVEL